MQFHTIKRKTKNTKRMQVGRGGKRGKTSGRGTKGQKARAGHKIRPEIRDLIKRIPKLRGRGKNSNLSIETKPQVVDIAAIELVFSNGDVVSRTTLLEKGVITLYKGKIPAVKILGAGALSKKLTVKGLPTSAAVKTKIEQAGGSVK
jgi:large subunit ribosomal protein L15